MPLDELSASLVTVVDTLDVDTDTLHRILADRRRRYALARLHEAGTPMHLGALAEAIAEWERESGEGNPSTELIHQTLYHVHVAKMAEAGLVEYDGLRDTVTLTDPGHALAAHLSPTTDDDQGSPASE